jgi:hypothetical protein
MKSKTEALGGIFKKVPYTAGFMWAKVSKPKKTLNNQNREKPLSHFNGFFTRVTERSADFFENAKGRTSELKGSFMDGFKSSQRQQEARARQIKESARPNSNVQENLLPDSQGAEELVQRLSDNDNDLEKEIEEIDKLVAEI